MGPRLFLHGAHQQATACSTPSCQIGMAEQWIGAYRDVFQLASHVHQYRAVAIGAADQPNVNTTYGGVP